MTVAELEAWNEAEHKRRAEYYLSERGPRTPVRAWKLATSPYDFDDDVASGIGTRERSLDLITEHQNERFGGNTFRWREPKEEPVPVVASQKTYTAITAEIELSENHYGGKGVYWCFDADGEIVLLENNRYRIVGNSKSDIISKTECNDILSIRYLKV